MQNDKNAGESQICHICYCNHFPKYAIMLSVKSKNNAPVPLFGKKRPWNVTKLLLSDGVFLLPRVQLGIGKIPEDQILC